MTRRALQVSESIRCLNESREGAAKTMFAKGWCHKLAEDPFLESDAVRAPTPSLPRRLLGWLSRIGLGAQDEQLIITVEFTAAVKLKSITIVGSVETDSNPADLKVFLNRDDVDFDVRSFFCAPRAAHRSSHS